MRLVRVFRWSSEFKCSGKGMEFNMVLGYSSFRQDTREKRETFYFVSELLAFSFF